MNTKEFLRYSETLLDVFGVNDLTTKCKDTLRVAHNEYAFSESKPFRNFEDQAKLAQTNRETVLQIFLNKHLFGIASFLQGNDMQRENVHGRIEDAVCYLVILHAMHYEKLRIGELPHLRDLCCDHFNKLPDPVDPVAGIKAGDYWLSNIFIAIENARNFRNIMNGYVSLYNLFFAIDLLQQLYKHIPNIDKYQKGEENVN